MTTISLALLVAMVVMYAVGFTLMLDRGLTRILLGFLLVGNATNLLLFLTSGSFGLAPLAGDIDAAEMSDPLPQAFILTAIVITFAVSAFLLALIYRSFRHTDNNDDRVSDDDEDIIVAHTEDTTAAHETVSDADFSEVSDFDSDGDGVDDREAELLSTGELVLTPVNTQAAAQNTRHSDSSAEFDGVERNADSDITAGGRA